MTEDRRTTGLLKRIEDQQRIIDGLKAENAELRFRADQAAQAQRLFEQEQP